MSLRFGRTPTPKSGGRVGGHPVDEPQQAPVVSGGGAALPDGTIPESSVLFDPDGGHAHDGADSTAVDHANLTNVLPDQHHARAHVLLDSSDHSDTLTGTVVRGDMLVGNSTPKWSRKAKGSSGDVWTMLDANDPGWAAAAGGSDERLVAVFNYPTCNLIGVGTALVNSFSNATDPECAPFTGTLCRIAVTFNGAPGCDASNYLDINVSINGGFGVQLIRTNAAGQAFVATPAQAVTSKDLMVFTATKTGVINAVGMTVKVYEK